MCQLLDQLKDDLDNINKERINQTLKSNSSVKNTQETVQKESYQPPKTNEDSSSVSISNFNFDTQNISDLEKLSNIKTKVLNLLKSK